MSMGDQGGAAGVAPSVAEAQTLARELLEPLGNRWAHVQAVAVRAEELGPAVETEDSRQLLVVAAWLHDIGYSPDLRRSGCHQIDGARYLTSHGFPARLCALVAHHSAATFEARERRLLSELNAWPREEGPVADALWMADMTTGPRGERVNYPERLSEILERYESNSIVYRAMRDAEPEIQQAISRTEQRLAAVHAI
jgi:putative nucleotidyltransferase with HDIG domain